jgi:hypothetical protein
MSTRTSFAVRPLALALLFAGGGAAFGQSFNIDVGATAGTNPTLAYGAGAEQPGFWNWVSGSVHGVNQGLSPLTGGAPIAAVRIDGGGNNLTINHALTMGDDEQLMDDIQDIGAAGVFATYTFFGLLPGAYWVYTYGWAPDDPNYRTVVHIDAPGSPDPDQAIGGDWVPAIGQQYVRTFSKHFVLYAGGPPLVVRCTSLAAAGNFGSVNGFQLVFDPGGACDGRFETYCTAKTNSAGCAPAIGHGGPNPPSAGAFVNGCVIYATGNLNNKPGLLFYSKTGYQAVPFQGGLLCVVPPIKRTPVVGSGGTPPPAIDCTGLLSQDFNAFIATGVDPGLQVPGQSVWAQWWSRDPGFPAPNNTNLSNALSFTICF